MAQQQTSQQVYKFNNPVQAVATVGNQQVWQQLSNTIDAFYKQSVQKKSALRKSEGSIAGLAASKGDEKLKLQMKSAGTIYGAAWNDAAIKAYGASIETDVANDINEYAVLNSENSQGFSSLVDKYKTEMLSGITDPTFNAIAANKIDEVAGLHEREIYKVENEKKNLINIYKIQDAHANNVETATAIVKQSVEKYYDGYKPFIGLEVQFGGKTIEEYQKGYGEQVQNQFATITSDLSKMMSVPGKHFSEGSVLKAKQDASTKIYTSIFLAEYNQAVESGEGLKMKEAFMKDPIAFINSKPHLSALLPKEILDEYGISTVGDGNMRDEIYATLDSEWKREQDVIEYNDKKEEEELADEQDDNMIDALTSLVQKEGTINIDYLTKNKDKYSNDDYETLLGAVTTSKYDYDDDAAVSELTMYLMTTDDGRKEQIATVNKYIKDGDVSYKTAIPLLKNALEDTMFDITRSNDYQLALSLLKPHFQKQIGAYGAFAQGEHLVWMTKAIAELQDRAKLGENPRDIVDEITTKFLGIREDQAAVSNRHLMREFRIGTGKDAKLDCEPAMNYVRARYNIHKNAITFAKDLASVKRYGCNIQANKQK